MPESRKQITDARAFQGRLERELVIGGLLIGLVVGVGLIYLIWGQSAAATSFICFLLFLVVVGGVWGFLSLLGWWANRE